MDVVLGLAHVPDGKARKKKKKRKSNAGAAEKQLPYQDTGRHLARALFLNGLDFKWKSEQRL